MDNLEELERQYNAARNAIDWQEMVMIMTKIPDDQNIEPSEKVKLFIALPPVRDGPQ